MTPCLSSSYHFLSMASKDPKLFPRGHVPYHYTAVRPSTHKLLFIKLAAIHTYMKTKMVHPHPQPTLPPLLIVRGKPSK